MSVRDVLHSSIDCWLIHRTWVRVKSIQVHITGIISPVASCYAIWVQTWDHFEYKVVQEYQGLRITKVREEIKNALEHVRSWCLSAMNSTAYENDWLLKPKSSLLFLVWIQVFIFYSLLIDINALSRRSKSEEIHGSAFNTFNQSLLVKVKTSFFFKSDSNLLH